MFPPEADQPMAEIITNLLSIAQFISTVTITSLQTGVCKDVIVMDFSLE